ncbi:MAG TPA: hypothetical protein VM554_12960 [Acidisarcina sp.]|nr:hypothetical protein [Acidisarcina sp.]
MIWNLQRRLQGWAAIALLLSATFVTVGSVGCTNAQVNDVLTKIADEIPQAVALADSVGPVVAALDPAIAIPVGIAVAAVDAALPLLQSDIRAYLANPNASLLARIESAINNLLTQNTQALRAFGIKAQAAQQQALAMLGSLNAVLVVIDGFIQQVEPKRVIQANAASRAVKLAEIDRYLDHGILERAAVTQGTTYAAFAAEQHALGM